MNNIKANNNTISLDKKILTKFKLSLMVLYHTKILFQSRLL